MQTRVENKVLIEADWAPANPNAVTLINCILGPLSSVWKSCFVSSSHCNESISHCRQRCCAHGSDLWTFLLISSVKGQCCQAQCGAGLGFFSSGNGLFWARGVSSDVGEWCSGLSVLIGVKLLTPSASCINKYSLFSHTFNRTLGCGSHIYFLERWVDLCFVPIPGAECPKVASSSTDIIWEVERVWGAVGYVIFSPKIQTIYSSQRKMVRTALYLIILTSLLMLFIVLSCVLSQ